jgi:hypothetical protein
MGELSHGGTHGCVCRWRPVPLAVGHDLACLLWDSSYMGSKHYLLSLSSYYNYAYMLPKQSLNLLLNSSTTNWHQPGVAS